jgi:hypothetical protein
MKKEEWIKVRDVSEIRAGMALKFVSCDRHGARDCIGTVLRQVESPRLHWDGADYSQIQWCPASKVFVTTHDPESQTCFCVTIPEGRLFRLELGDEEGQEEEQTEKQPKQMERTE